MTTLGFVLPCYNEALVIDDTVARLSALLDRLVAEGRLSEQSFMLFVNDCSSDDTWALIGRHHSIDKRVKGISLSHNCGHQTAIMAGMMAACGMADAVITIDADLQDDLDVVPHMLGHYENGYDVVYGVKQQRRADSVLKRMTAQAFYRLQTSMGVEAVYNHADFRLMSRRAIETLSLYKEKNLYLRGLIPLMGLPSATVGEVIGERMSGESKYSVGRMFNLAIDGITSFSIKPIYCILYLGIVFILISMCILLYVVHALVVGTAVAGWASLMLSVWFASGVVLVALSVIGIYIGKIYIEVKARPQYIIKEHLT